MAECPKYFYGRVYRRFDTFVQFFLKSMLDFYHLAAVCHSILVIIVTNTVQPRYELKFHCLLKTRFSLCDILSHSSMWTITSAYIRKPHFIWLSRFSMEQISNRSSMFSVHKCCETSHFQLVVLARSTMCVTYVQRSLDG